MEKSPEDALPVRSGPYTTRDREENDKMRGRLELFTRSIKFIPMGWSKILFQWGSWKFYSSDQYIKYSILITDDSVKGILTIIIILKRYLALLMVMVIKFGG